MAEIWRKQAVDPIARNPKDGVRPEEAIQAQEVSRAEPAFTPMPAPDARGAQSPMDLLASILRFKWTAVLVAILVAAPIIAAIWTQMIPLNSSRAEIRVRPVIPRLVFRTDENGAIPFYDSFVNTQVSLIRNPTLLQRVLDDEKIQATDWYKNPSRSLMQQLRGSPPDSAMERLRESLVARPRHRTEIIDVSFTCSSSREAVLILDVVTNEYLKYTYEQSSATENLLQRQLLNQYQTLKNEIQGIEVVCSQLRQSLGTDSPQDLVASRRLRLDETDARLNELRNRIKVLEWEVSQVAGADGNSVSAVAGATESRMLRYHDDAEWRELDLNVRTVKHQIENSRYLSIHPERIRLASDLEFAEGLLRLREEQLDEQWRDRIQTAAIPSGVAVDANMPSEEGVLSVKYQLARAKREEELLQAELSRQQSDFAELFADAQMLEDENSKLRDKRELFDAVRQSLDQKNVERNVPGSIDILTSAFSPPGAGQDRRMVFTAMALFFGLGLGGGAAFLRARRDQVIYTPRDMPQPMQAPFLGYMPLIPAAKLLVGSPGDQLERYQLSLIESVRVMRTTLLSRLNGKACTSVLVSSATSGTGKSSFTIVLGKSLAQAGRNVLMIDADFHKRTLSRRLDLPDSPGLIDALSTRSVEEQYISPTETLGLSILPAGRQASGSPVLEEIANDAFRACISQLSEQYDFILLDGPPILLVADAVIICGQVDGTIMVEREYVSQRAEVADALIRLGSAGGRLLGTVFVGSMGQRDYSNKYGCYYASSPGS